MKHTTETIKNINRSFELTDKSLLLLFLGHKTDKKYLDELENTIQHDLSSYKYLMHPTRLMILKLLHGEYSLTSLELTKLLKMPWSTYGSHIRSLENKGYVEIKDTFDKDGSVRQVVILTEQGKQEYEGLFDLLQEFIEKKTPLEYILNVDSKTYMNDDLYPSE